MNRQDSQPHQIIRVRHELRRRKLVVSGVESLTPRMRRIRFTSPELADFHSPSPDDHIKLFFPRHDAPAGEPVMRDFTPRAFDNAERTLTIRRCCPPAPGPPSPRRPQEPRSPRRSAHC
jgi:NADPH-dependent ferric siderophore reductase